MIDDVASTSPKYELGKVAFNSMFLKRKKSQCFGKGYAEIFFKTYIRGWLVGIFSKTKFFL